MRLTNDGRSRYCEMIATTLAGSKSKRLLILSSVSRFRFMALGISSVKKLNKRQTTQWAFGFRRHLYWEYPETSTLGKWEFYEEKYQRIRCRSSRSDVFSCTPETGDNRLLRNCSVVVRYSSIRTDGQDVALI